MRSAKRGRVLNNAPRNETRPLAQVSKIDPNDRPLTPEAEVGAYRVSPDDGLWSLIDYYNYGGL